MRPPLITASSVRGAMPLAAIMICIVFGGFLAGWTIVQNDAKALTRADIQSTYSSLLAHEDMFGPVAIIDAIDRRLENARSRGSQDYAYLVRRLDGRRVAGNLAEWPTQMERDGQWVVFNDPQTPGIKILALQSRFSGDFEVLVGKQMRISDTLYNKILPLAAGVTILNLLLMLWWTVSSERRVRGELNKVIDVLDAASSGTLQVRLPDSGRDDEFSRISSAIIRADRLCEMVRLHREQLGQTEELWCRMDVQGNMSRGSTPETVTAVKASITGSPSDALYQVLIAPFSTKLKKISHLYIASTGAVNALPWAALRNSRGSYLIEMHNLAVVPSIAGFAGYEQQQASKASKASLSFAGIGAPCVGGQLGKQCDAANSGSSHRGALPSGEGDLNQTLYLSALPHSGRELTRASELFGQQKFVLTGQQATKPVVLDALRTAKPNIVVFATHGLSAGEFGLKEPGLVLSPEAISDGVLTPSILLASELAKIDLGSELVVLSACSTASENSNDSTGTLSGFSRALMQAGAQNLIAVHGPVEDAAMGSFMVSFFKAYVRQQTRDPAQALRQASRKAIKKGDHRVWPLVFAASMR